MVEAAVVPQTRATTSWGTPALDLPAGVALVCGTTDATSSCNAAGTS